MAKPSESTKHAYTYVPPSVQRSIQAHMDRTMPVNLKKYQSGNGYIPQHAERAMSQHLQKNLPSHLKQYGDAYLHQNVVYPSRGGSSAAFSPTATSSPAPQNTVRPTSNTFANPGQQIFSSQAESQPSPTPTLPNQPPPSSPDQDPYGFIMNPSKPPRQQFTLPGDSMGVRIAFAAGGLIVLIILFSFISSFLNKSGNLQKDRLLSLAQIESQIASAADTASQKITNKNLLYRTATVKVTMESSQKQVVSELAKRGKKAKDKELNVVNPSDAAALSEGEQNGRYDEAYVELLEKQLSAYQQRLKAVYDSGSASEKEVAAIADSQIQLLLSGISGSQQ